MRLRLLVVLGQAFEHLLDVRTRRKWRRVLIAHGCSFAARSPEASRVSNTIPTSGCADADAGTGADPAADALASLIADSSACRARCQNRPEHDLDVGARGGGLRVGLRVVTHRASSGLSSLCVSVCMTEPPWVLFRLKRPGFSGGCDVSRGDSDSPQFPAHPFLPYSAKTPTTSPTSARTEHNA